MSIINCLAARVAAGEITREQADAAERIINDRRQQMGYRPGSPEEAADLALLASRMKEASQTQRRQLSLQAMKQMRASQWVADQPHGFWASTPEAKAYAGTMSVLVPDKSGGARHESVEGMQLGYRRILQGMFADGIDAMRSKMAGLKRQTPNMVDFVYEMFGQNRGNVAARAAADAWRTTNDWAADRWISLGGKLTRKETWRQPQAHDAALLRAAGHDRWVADVEQLVADGGVRFFDFDTGAPLNAVRRADVMDSMFESITTDGANKIVPGQARGTKLANRRDTQRAMEFMTPEAWLSYHNAYGPGEAQIFDMLTAHIDGIASDLAKIDVLGPNPNHTVRVLVDEATKAGVSKAKVHMLETVWSHVNGDASMPVSDTMARVGGEVRSFLTAAQLGGAFLSSTTDFVNGTAAVLYNGLPIWDTLTRYLKLFNPLNGADQQTAWRLGLGAEAQTQRFSGAAREHLELTRGVGSKLAEVTMRASLLETHTQALQHAVGWEFLSTLADQSGRAFGALDGRLSKFLASYGVDAAGWDAIRANVATVDGLPMIDPGWLIKQGGAAADAGLKLVQGISAEQRLALAMPGSFERAWMMRGNRPGTAIGEALSSFWQYKGFPVSILTGHVMRGIMQMRHEGKYWYLPGFVIGATLMGALALQLKALAKGQDMRDPTDPKFWAAAAYQGGGAGIAGDFLYGSTARTGKDAIFSFLGPVASLGSDALSLSLSNAGQAARGEDTNFGREAVRFAKNYTPGSSLWYTRLATERWIWNSLQEWADPKYQESFRRTEDNARRETGQGYWWRPGQGAPSRAPGVSQQR